MVEYNVVNELELPELAARASQGYPANMSDWVPAAAPVSAESQTTGPRIVLGIDYGTTFTG